MLRREKSELVIRLFLIGYLLLFQGYYAGCEGTKQLNSNSVQSTSLYLCNDFTSHCTSSAGLRSQFATYDATQSAADVDRLYFVTANASEAVYMGFQGSGTTSPANPARHIVYRIKNLAGTIVQAEQSLPTSGAGYISTFAQAVNGPNQLPSPNITTGYTALIFTPPAPGTYYIEFTVKRDDNGAVYVGTFDLLLFDITVGNTVTHLPKPGRLYSKSWQFSESNAFYGKNYFISDDSIVTSTQFSGMQGGHWIQYCNQTGCGNSSANWLVERKSLYHQQALFPQYKIFLNDPDSVLFPAATTLGQIVPPIPYGVQNCLTGHILFHIHVNKPGNVELTLTFPSPYVSRVYNQVVATGDNLFDWDGLDGTSPTGVPVPNGTLITFTVKYINGLTNLPLYDVEGNDYGFTIALVKPAGTTPAVFWDDTNIPSGTSNTVTGCNSPPGCHDWTSSGSSGFGDLNTINTWWYNVSTTTTPSQIEVFRGPGALTISAAQTTFCANSSGAVFSVNPDVNTDIYHWSYTPATGVTIVQATPASPSVTVNFGPTATSGTLQVYGSNTNCAMNGPTASIPITINPNPVPTISGPNTGCSGTVGIYTTETGKVNYQWNVSAGGTITGGSATSNTITVTWSATGTHTVSVNYANPGTLCTSPTPTVYTVNISAHPVPTLSGTQLVCVGTSGLTYYTETGKQNYTWSISPGGTITAGGNSTSSTATVTWGTVGAQYISVNYTDPLTLCSATNPTQLNVTVNTLPVPSLSGPVSACVGVAGNQYTTDPGMNNYIWVVTGGTITAGGTSSSNTAYVKWNSTGFQSVSVNYTLPFSTCTAASPATVSVNVLPLPTPAITSGPTSACAGVAGNIYSTQAGMSMYLWSISGGTITGGGGFADNYATVTWDNVGIQKISINFTDPGTLCTAAAPADYFVTVKPLPVPAFSSGDNSVCVNSPGHVYTTQAGMSEYIWTITGGTITGGGGVDNNSATVTWTSVGNHSILVSYTDPATLCTAATPAEFDVTVKPLPVPTFISGINSACQNSTGNVYTTEQNMSDYTWTITGGTITAGGNTASNTATVTWTTVGPQIITVLYTDPSTQCTAAEPASFQVEVKSLPVPTIGGPATACINTAGPQYSTESGMSNYAWTVPNGTITGGGGSDLISVVWNTLGTQTMTVTYTGTNGCDAAQPAQKPVLVNNLPSPAIAGTDVICNLIATTYTTQPGMQNYLWSVSDPVAVITGGTTADNAITVKWVTPGTQSVSVNYTLGTGCTAPAPVAFPVTVNQAETPVIHESPAGRNCITFSNTYTTQPGMTNYSWAVSPGGTITSAANTNEITVIWNSTGSQYVDVNFKNTFGCIAQVPTRFAVTVNPLPVSAIASASGPDCESMPHTYNTTPDPACTYEWSITPAAIGSITSGQGSSQVIISWQSFGAASLLVTATNNTTGCFSSSNFTTTVDPKPNPVFTPCFDLVTTPYAKKFILRGASPYLNGQGVFSGNRVSFDASLQQYIFDPNGASTGNYAITYTYTNNYGCPATSPSVSVKIQANAFTCGGKLKDVRDGKSYKTASIGGRCWMAENLDFGETLAENQTPTDNCIDERVCQVEDTSCTKYGGLYQWNELMRYGTTIDSKGICPPEWHVPSETEWQALLVSLGTGVTPPDGIAGSFLKDKNLSSGIHALLSGVYYLEHSWAFYFGDLTGTMFWTSTSSGIDHAVARGVNNYNPSTSRYTGSRENAFPVRCVRDN